MTKPDGERIQAVEDKVDIVQEYLTEIKNDIKEVRAMVQNKLIDHITMFDRITSLEKSIMDIKKEITDIDKKGNLRQWLFPTMSAGAGALVVWLIEKYLEFKPK